MRTTRPSFGGFRGGPDDCSMDGGLAGAQEGHAVGGMTSASHFLKTRTRPYRWHQTQVAVARLILADVRPCVPRLP
jgi:hypothetical protein